MKNILFSIVLCCSMVTAAFSQSTAYIPVSKKLYDTIIKKTVFSLMLPIPAILIS